MLQGAMIEAKGSLLRVDNISHFKSLMAGHAVRAVSLPIFETALMSKAGGWSYGLTLKPISKKGNRENQP